MLSITTDSSILSTIKASYSTDLFCQKLIANGPDFGATKVNDLWYIGDRLLVPRVSDICENLFRLAHDSAGHFGADKSYSMLCDCYYWPNMRKDLEQGYILSCS
jgi:hypothetical protein